jgi:hypothetical protein
MVISISVVSMLFCFGTTKIAEFLEIPKAAVEAPML